LPSVPLEPSAAGAEPAGLQSGEFVAAAGVASTNRELVADQSAATAGEDWRTAGEACALLLATAGGRTSDASAVRGDAGSDLAVADTDGIESWWVQSAAESSRQEVGQGEVLQKWRNIGQFRRCWYGCQTAGHGPDENLVSQCRKQARWVYYYRRV